MAFPFFSSRRWRRARRKGGWKMKTARRKASTVLLLAVLMTVFGAFCALNASAEWIDPVAFNMEATGTEMTGPGDISIQVRITNTTGTDMTDPVTLYDPSGDVMTAFGTNGQVTLKAGQQYPWSGTYSVSQEELEKGTLVFTIRYQMTDSSGSIFENTQENTIRLTYAGEHARLGVTRKVTPEVCRQGKTVTVTYELVNTGNVELTNIKVAEKLNGRSQTVDHLSPGGSQKLTFSINMGNADLTSGATITYKVTGESGVKTETVPEVVIPLAKPDLSMRLEAVTPNVNIGETATLMLTFVNNGNVSYSSVTVRDAKRGEVLTGLEIPAGTTVSFPKEFVLSEPATFKFTALLPDNTGESREITADEVRVQVFDPDNDLILTLDLSSDTTTVSEFPAVMRFTLNVTNNGDSEVQNVRISHGSVPIRTIALLSAGQTVKVECDVEVSQAGQFRFTASAVDNLGNNRTFQSNVIRVSYTAPTVAPTTVPVPTVAPLVTERPVTDEDLDPVVVRGKDITRWLAYGFAGLLALAIILLIVAAIMRGRVKHRSENAYDHLDLARRRDYGRDPDEADEDEEEDRDDASAAPSEREEVTEDDIRPSVTYRSVPDDPMDDGAPEPEVSPEDSAETVQRIDDAERAYSESDEGGFRVSRRTDAAADDAGAEAQGSHRRAAKRRQNVGDDEE